MDTEFATIPARDYEDLNIGDEIVGGLANDGFYAVSPYIATTSVEKLLKRRKRKKSVNNALGRKRNELLMGRTFVRQKPRSPFRSIRIISC